jgi:hypothetical protein
VGNVIPLIGQKNEQQRKKEMHQGLERPQTKQFPHNNQPKIGVRNSVEYGGEVWQKGGAGELWYHYLGHWIEQPKINEYEIHCGLRQPPHDEYEFPHNN